MSATPKKKEQKKRNYETSLHLPPVLGFSLYFFLLVFVFVFSAIWLICKAHAKRAAYAAYAQYDAAEVKHQM